MRLSIRCPGRPVTFKDFTHSITKVFFFSLCSHRDGRLQTTITVRSTILTYPEKGKQTCIFSSTEYNETFIYTQVWRSLCKTNPVWIDFFLWLNRLKTVYFLLPPYPSATILKLFPLPIHPNLPIVQIHYIWRMSSFRNDVMNVIFLSHTLIKLHFFKWAHSNGAPRVSSRSLAHGLARCNAVCCKSCACDSSGFLGTRTPPRRACARTHKESRARSSHEPPTEQKKLIKKLNNTV